MKAAFLDRDGVINRDLGFVGAWREFEFMPGVHGALRDLQRLGYELVIVTNQSGIARGYFDEAAYQTLTGRMLEALAAAGVTVRGVYHCPHHPDGIVPGLAVRCDCRKPQPGLLLRAAREHGLDLGSSLLIGDRSSDLEAARRAGVGRAYRVGSGEGAPDGTADGEFADLAECVRALAKLSL